MASTKFPTPSHLIIVCCHGIWLGDTPNEDNWLIRGFQAGETPTFIEHIKMGLRLLVKDEPGQNALMFSGAPTRKETHISEASSYLSLGQSQAFWSIIPNSSPSSGPQTSATRHSPATPRTPYTPYIIAETRALDSFQNVSLPLQAFTSLYGKPPQRVTVISHEFKRARFEELHFLILRATYAGVEFRFEGKDPEYMIEGNEEYDRERTKMVREMERKNGFELWLRDPEGEGEQVRRKRKERDVWGVQFAVEEEKKGELGRFTKVG